MAVLGSCKDESAIGLQEDVIDIENRQRVHKDGPGWEPCEAANLKIYFEECLDETSQPIWNSAILDAVDQINAVPNVGIHMEFVDNMDDADIVYRCHPTDNCWGGFVIADSVNQNGRARNVYFNTDLLDGDCIDCDPSFEQELCLTTMIVLHETMHALGFYHNYSDPFSVLVPWTPNEDPNSVMNNIDDWCNANCEFSDFDIIALQEVYPCDCNPPTLVGDDYLCVDEIGVYCIQSEGDVEVEWNMPSGTFVEGEGNCITLSSPYPIVYNLQAVVVENGCEFLLQKDVEIVEDRPCIPIPSLAPFPFRQLCTGETVCYEFEDASCISELIVNWDSPNLAVFTEGTKLCLSSLSVLPEMIQIEIISVSHCGRLAEPVYWDLYINDPLLCGGFNP